MTWNCNRIFITSFHLEDTVYKRYFDTLSHYLIQNLPSDWSIQTFAEKLYQVQQKQFASHLLNDSKNVGIYFGSSGVLECAFLNQTMGIRAALVHNHYIAKMCREHNDANVCIISTDCIGQKLAADLILNYLRNKFDEEAKNKIRLGLIDEMENKYFSNLKI